MLQNCVPHKKAGTVLAIDVFGIHDTTPFALSVSKGFDKARPEPVEGLSPNGG